MNAVLESPLYALGFGVVFVLLFGWLWLQTGRRACLVGVVAALAITGLLLVLERTVTTPREEVVNTIAQIARDAETNDIELLVTHASSDPNSPAGIAARGEIPRATIERVALKPVKVNFESTTKATARFNAVVVGSYGGANGRYPCVVELVLLKEGNHWRVFSYSHEQAFKRTR